MATSALTPKSTRWNSALGEHRAALAAFAAVHDHPRTRIFREVGELALAALERLVRVPSPSPAAVREKLQALYGEDIYEETAWGCARRTIIGDLWRIQLLMEGVDPAEAAGQIDLAKVAADWSAAEVVYDSKVALDQERSRAAEALLKLWAPDLAAVAKKLQVMMAGDDGDDAQMAGALAFILGDVRCLSTDSTADIQ